MRLAKIACHGASWCPISFGAVTAAGQSYRPAAVTELRRRTYAADVLFKSMARSTAALCSRLQSFECMPSDLFQGTTTHATVSVSVETVQVLVP